MPLKYHQVSLHWSPRWIYQFALPRVVSETSSPSPSWPATWDFKTLSLASLLRLKCCFITGHSQHLFKLLLSVCHCSDGNCPVMSFACFPVELFVFFLLSCESSFCILVLVLLIICIKTKYMYSFYALKLVFSPCGFFISRAVS